MKATFTVKEKHNVIEYYLTHPGITYADLADHFNSSVWVVGSIVRDYKNGGVMAKAITKCNEDAKELIKKAYFDQKKAKSVPVTVTVPTKTEALVISDPDQVQLVLDAVNVAIEQKKKELDALYSVRDSLIGVQSVPKKSSGKTPLFENK